MSTLNTQVVGELAAGLEGTVRVTTVVLDAAALVLLTMLMRRMTAFDAEVMSELASRLEGAIGVALDIISQSKGVKRGRLVLTPLSLLLAPPMVSW